MSCKHNEYFVKTYVPFPLRFASDSAYGLTDVLDMEAVLIRKRDRVIVNTWTYLGGGITNESGVLTIQILDSDVVLPGEHDLRLTLTDLASKVHGICAYPSRLVFK